MPTSVSMEETPSGATNSTSTTASGEATQPTTPLPSGPASHDSAPQIHTQVHLPPMQHQMSPLESMPYPVFPATTSGQPSYPYYYHHPSVTAAQSPANASQMPQVGPFASANGWLAPTMPTTYSQAPYASQTYPSSFYNGTGAAPTPFFVPSSYGSSHQHQARPSYIQLPPNSMQAMMPPGQATSNTMTSAYSLHTPHSSRLPMSPSNVQTVSVQSATATHHPAGAFPVASHSQGLRHEAYDPRTTSSKPSALMGTDSGHSFASLQAPRPLYHVIPAATKQGPEQHQSPDSPDSSRSTTSCPASPFRPGVDAAHTPVLYSAVPQDDQQQTQSGQWQPASRAPSTAQPEYAAHHHNSAQQYAVWDPRVGHYVPSASASVPVASMDAILPRRPQPKVEATPTPPRRRESHGEIWPERRASNDERGSIRSPTPVAEVEPLAVRRRRRIPAKPKTEETDEEEEPRPRSKRRPAKRASDPDVYAAVIAATTTRIPGPIAVPSLTKKHRGRAVVKDPAVIASNIVHVCPIPECGACFKRKEHVKRHIRGIHSVDKVSLQRCGAGRWSSLNYSAALSVPLAQVRTILFARRQSQGALHW